jgi:hypothetical protein
MDYKAIWNEICFHVNKNRNASERDFQTTIEFLFEKLGWSQYNGEIELNKTLSIGSANSVKPDIVIKHNEQIILVVEMKKPNTKMSERNAEQLRSYMRLLRLNFGVLLGETLQLFYELPIDNTLPIQINDIPFDENSQEGTELIKLLCKNDFSHDTLQKYCEDKYKNIKKHEISQKEVFFLCSDEGVSKVVALIKENLLLNHSEEIVSSIIDKITIRILHKEEAVEKKLPRNIHLPTSQFNIPTISCDEVKNKTKFEDWLRKKYALNTVYSYSAAIDKISKHYSDNEQGVDLYRVDNLSEIQQIADLYGSKGKYFEFGNKGHGTNKAAINAYAKYINQRNND